MLPKKPTRSPSPSKKPTRSPSPPENLPRPPHTPRHPSRSPIYGGLQTYARAARAEWCRIQGRRGPLVRASLPLGFGLPVLVTLLIAVVAERIHQANGLFQVRAVGTDNAVYWVIFLGVTIHAVIAAYAQASSVHGPLGELSARMNSSVAATILARWAVWATIAAACSAVAVAVVLLMLPVLCPQVYGTVSIASSPGLRFLWAVPVYAIAAVGVGVGLGAVFASPAGVVTGLSVWAFFIETAVIYIPNGARLVNWMPFMNGAYATGQQLTLDPAWGRDGALAYVFLVAIVVLLVGWGVAVGRRARR